MLLFLVATGLTFFQAVETHVGTGEPLQTILFMSVILWLPVFITVISMRLFAEEKRSGTIETLMTAPVTDRAVVLGKYAGALSFLVIVTAPSLGSVFVLAFMSPGIQALDIGSFLGGCLIMFLLSGLCLAIGLLVSLMTRNQILAAICCFCAICIPLVLKHAVSFLPIGTASVIEYLSVETHIVDFTRGSVDTRPVLLYVSGTVFVLFAAVRVLEMRRWL
jgi:ABC-2 type transport system permease protein